MIQPNISLLYVKNLDASIRFYTDLLGSAPDEASPNFAQFTLAPGVTLGLWVRDQVRPLPENPIFAQSELCLAVENDAAVQSSHTDWIRRGWPVLQAPTQMGFGFTGVTADPDGHRLRVYASSMRDTTQLTHFVLAYVRNATESAQFYTQLLGRAPVEASPEYAQFALSPGLMLGLWARHTVEPTPEQPGPAQGELCIPLGDSAAVQALYADWTAKGWPILQTPTQMDFGFTFVATDPDGLRLRVLAPQG